MTRNLLLFCAIVMFAKVNVSVVAPKTVALLVRLVKVVPPSVLTCHCAVGVGAPLAAAVKVMVLPTCWARFAGCCVMVGAAVETLRVAGALVALPTELVKTARYWLLF